MVEKLTQLDFAALFAAALAWISSNILNWHFALQVAVGVVALFLSLLIGKVLRGRFDARYSRNMAKEGYVGDLLRHTSQVIWLVVAFLVFRLLTVVFIKFELQTDIFRIGASLAFAFAVVRISASLFRSKGMAKFIQIVAVTLAVLNIFKLYAPTMALLGKLGIKYGDTFISVLMVVKGIVLLVLALQLASFLARMADRRIDTMDEVSPSLKVLMSKGISFALITGAIVMAVDAVGISLTGLTVFSGALGVGVGFGLRKIFSNLVSGIILLLDKSIKPGDTIEVNNVYGYIRSINARFASVVSRDGKEFLVPNENLIANTVVNWTYSSSEVRLRIPVGVSYDCDLEEACEIVKSCAEGVNRVLTDPAPAVRIRAFGADSIDLELRVWIGDPDKGTGGVKHQICLNIWRKLKEAGIEIPYAQRDVNIRHIPEELSDKILAKLEK